MLGKGSCLPRTTSSRSLLIPYEDSDGDTTFCSNSQVTGPTLCSPCKIVIGFEVEAEKKAHVDVCESPRSVLESSTVLSSHDKQQVVARSPRSGLGSLLAAKSGSEEDVCIGIGIVAEASVNSKPHASSSPSKVVTALLAKTSEHDPMDCDICLCQGQGLHVNLQADMEDQLLDADISPFRTTDFCMQLKEKIECDFGKTSTPKPLSFFPGNCVKVVKMADDTSTEHSHVHANPGKDVVDLFAAPDANVHDKESICTWMDAPRQALPVHTHKGEVYVYSCEKQSWHCSDLDVEDINHQSIFSTASPPTCSHSLARSSAGFLKMCNFCGRSLCLGKDIFMYRGDQPFCSAECRYQKIVRDESKDRKGG